MQGKSGWARAGFAAVLVWSAGAMAQTLAVEGADEPAEAERRTLEAVRQGSEAARDARGPFTRVTYEQVLAAPDDIDLNYNFAQTQIADGDLRGAMATLERILLNRPDLQRVRLLYAVVLIRLDNTDEAERELRALQGQQMPDSLRAEIDTALRGIERKKRTTRYSASLTIGGQINTNRDAAPNSNQRVAGGLTFVAPDGTTDSGMLAIGTVEMRHDIGAQAGHEYFLRAGSFVSEQSKVDALDLQAFTAETGLTYKTDFADITPSVSFGHYMLQGERYLDTYGLKLDLRRRLNAQWTVYLTNEFQHQDYDRVTKRADGFAIAPLAHERTGNKIEAEGGAIWRLDPRNILRGSVTLSGKDAEREFHSYTYGRAELSHIWLLGQGMFLISTASAALQDYDEADQRISPKTRKDNIYTARAAFGVPLITWMPQTEGTAFGDMVLSLTAQLTHQDSNITNYTYTDVSGQVLVTKRWEF